MHDLLPGLFQHRFLVLKASMLSSVGKNCYHWAGKKLLQPLLQSVMCSWPDTTTNSVNLAKSPGNWPRQVCPRYRFLPQIVLL